MVEPHRFEDPKYRGHVYRMRRKTSGFHNRRFGKAPRYLNPACGPVRGKKKK